MTDAFTQHLNETEGAAGRGANAPSMRSPDQPSISLAISDLEREASSLRTENIRYHGMLEKHTQRITDLDDLLRTANRDRDSYMRLSAELKTLLDSAATLILEGLKRAREGIKRTDTVETIMQPEALEVQP